MFLNVTYFNIFKTFISETDACDYVCGEESLQTYGCSPFEYENGVCNDECNVASCNFDGWDCNQLCNHDEYGASDCNTLGLFDNGGCDIACNNSYCNYDNYECINT